jgi:hypothetical protein
MSIDLAPAISTPELPLQTDEPAREHILRELLPYDYDYAADSGLLDVFYYDQASGEDGLLHTLAGTLHTDHQGNAVPEGYHHEPSGEAVWPTTLVNNEPLPSTRVDRAYVEAMPSKRRAKYREYPFEPYAATVVVNGLRKMTINSDPKTGEKRLVSAKNNMYPKEYDALAVMQAVRIARETRDTTKDTDSTDNRGRPVVVAEGSAPLIDGITPMRIRMILDKETGRVMTAIPQTPQSPGSMKLTPEQIDHHLFGV